MSGGVVFLSQCVVGICVTQELLLLWLISSYNVNKQSFDINEQLYAIVAMLNHALRGRCNISMTNLCVLVRMFFLLLD